MVALPDMPVNKSTNTVSSGPIFEGTTHELYRTIMSIIKDTNGLAGNTLERTEGVALALELGVLYVRRKIDQGAKRSATYLRKRFLKRSIDWMNDAIVITGSTPDHVARIRDCHHKLLNCFK